MGHCGPIHQSESLMHHSLTPKHESESRFILSVYIVHYYRSFINIISKTTLSMQLGARVRRASQSDCHPSLKIKAYRW